MCAGVCAGGWPVRVMSWVVCSRTQLWRVCSSFELCCLYYYAYKPPQKTTFGKSVPMKTFRTLKMRDRFSQIFFFTFVKMGMLRSRLHFLPTPRQMALQLCIRLTPGKEIFVRAQEAVLFTTLALPKASTSSPWIEDMHERHGRNRGHTNTTNKTKKNELTLSTRVSSHFQY